MSVYTVFIWTSFVVCCDSLKIGVLIHTPKTGETEDIVNKCLTSGCFGARSTDNVELIWRYTNETNGLLLSYEVWGMVKKRIDGLITVVDCRAHPVLSDQAKTTRIPVVHVSGGDGHCQDDHFYSRHITPCYKVKIQMLKDLLAYTDWHSFAFIFDESIGFRERKETIFALSSIQVESTILVLNSTSNTTVVTRKLEQLKKRGLRHAIVWTQMSTIRTVFIAASQVYMNQINYYWIIFKPGVSPPDVTALFNDTSPSNALVVTRISPHKFILPCLLERQLLRGTNQALIWELLEAILMLSSTYHDTVPENNTLSKTRLPAEPNPMKTQKNKPSFKGFTSEKSIQYKLYSVGNPAGPLQSVGFWRNGHSGLSVHSPVGLFVNRFRDFGQQVINITAKQELPFVIRTFNGTTPVYTGLSIDILNELAERLNFRYVVMDPEDRRYGAPNEDGTWNGMVGMVKRQEVIMAVGPFSITALRDTVIDYTKPYMDDSIGILTRRPQKGANLFQMMRPFSTNVWICIAAVVILGGVMLTIINRLTPYGCHHPNDPVITDEHSFSQNFWIIYMSVMEQGAIYFPAANSSRCILGFWWIFTILIISTYTANLAAFLTVADPTPTINSLKELLQQEDLEVLVQDGSNLWSLFKDSNMPLYQDMWKRLQGSPSVDGLDAALPYVRTGKYAYVGDKSTLEYVAAQECLTFVVAEESFNAGTYGFVIPKNSPFKEAMDYYIMKMLEAGLLSNWRQKWWARPSNCTSKAGSGSASRLSLDTLGGVFIVYLVCSVVAVVILLASIVANNKCSQGKQENTDNSKPKNRQCDIGNGTYI